MSYVKNVIEELEFEDSGDVVVMELLKDGVKISEWKEYYDFGGSLGEIEVVSGELSEDEIWELLIEDEI